MWGSAASPGPVVTQTGEERYDSIKLRGLVIREGFLEEVTLKWHLKGEELATPSRGGSRERPRMPDSPKASPGLGEGQRLPLPHSPIDTGGPGPADESGRVGPSLISL